MVQNLTSLAYIKKCPNLKRLYYKGNKLLEQVDVKNEIVKANAMITLNPTEKVNENIRPPAM